MTRNKQYGIAAALLFASQVEAFAPIARAPLLAGTNRFLYLDPDQSNGQSNRRVLVPPPPVAQSESNDRVLIPPPPPQGGLTSEVLIDGRKLTGNQEETKAIKATAEDDKSIKQTTEATEMKDSANNTVASIETSLKNAESMLQVDSAETKVIDESLCDNTTREMEEAKESRPVINVEAAAEAASTFESLLETRQTEMEARSSTSELMLPTLDAVNENQERGLEKIVEPEMAIASLKPEEKPEIKEPKTTDTGKADISKSDTRPANNVEAAAEAPSTFASLLETRQTEMEERSSTSEQLSPFVDALDENEQELPEKIVKPETTNTACKPEKKPEIKETRAVITDEVDTSKSDPRPAINVEAAAEAASTFASLLETRQSEMEVRSSTSKQLPPSVGALGETEEKVVEKVVETDIHAAAFQLAEEKPEIKETKATVTDEVNTKKSDLRSAINVEATTEAASTFTSLLETRQTEMQARSSTSEQLSLALEDKSSADKSETDVVQVEKKEKGNTQEKEFPTALVPPSSFVQTVKAKKEKKPSYWDSVTSSEISSGIIKTLTPDRGIRQLKEASDVETLGFAATRFAWGIVKGGTAACLGVHAIAVKKAPDDAVRAAADSTQSFVSAMIAVGALGWKYGERVRELADNVQLEAAKKAEVVRLIENEQAANSPVEKEQAALRLAEEERSAAAQLTAKKLQEAEKRIVEEAKRNEANASQEQNVPFFTESGSSQMKIVESTNHAKQ